jgi:ubiquinone/menaquinone biosynthesis C-methylase UbiE
MLEYLNSRFDWQDADLVSALDEVSLWSAAFGLMLLDHLELHTDMTVLDVGCGNGFPLLELSQRLGPSSYLYGLDLWQRALERIKFKITSLGIGNVGPVRGDAALMGFKDESFDLIVSNLGINNFESPGRVMPECFRVSKAGGRIALTTNPEGHMQEFYDVFRETLQESGLGHLLAELEGHIRHRLPAAHIVTLLEKAGFGDSRTVERSLTMGFVDGTAFLGHYFIRCGFLAAWKAIVPVQDLERVFARLEANLNAAAREQGVLKVTVPMAYIEARKSLTS